MFECCTSLKEIVIPPSVNSIGSYAFYSCTSLDKFEIPPFVTEIKDFTFSKCSSLSEIMIPQSITSIGIKAFYSCESLTKLEIPLGIQIGENAFKKTVLNNKILGDNKMCLEINHNNISGNILKLINSNICMFIFLLILILLICLIFL